MAGGSQLGHCELALPLTDSGQPAMSAIGRGCVKTFSSATGTQTELKIAHLGEIRIC